MQCDGARPRCTRCQELDLPCRFDVAEGVSRAERMKLLKRESMSGRAEEMERVIKALRTGSDDQASAVLARLRIGDRLDDIVKTLPPSTFSTVVSKPPRYAWLSFPTTIRRGTMVTWVQLTCSGLYKYLWQSCGHRRDQRLHQHSLCVRTRFPCSPCPDSWAAYRPVWPQTDCPATSAHRWEREATGLDRHFYESTLLVHPVQARGLSQRPGRKRRRRRH
jgi:hypothetical protein